LQDQDKILEEFRKTFLSFQDVRQHIDAATEVTNNVLKVVQGDSAALDEICAGVKEIKMDTGALGALDKMSERLDNLARQASVTG
jgi:putative component of toxin-antitoxin plasmid stabilization module